jgi:hypothetical protein
LSKGEGERLQEPIDHDQGHQDKGEAGKAIGSPFTDRDVAQQCHYDSADLQ